MQRTSETSKRATEKPLAFVRPCGSSLPCHSRKDGRHETCAAVRQPRCGDIEAIASCRGLLHRRQRVHACKSRGSSAGKGYFSKHLAGSNKQQQA